MATLSAKFRLIDEMSAKLDHIAQSGQNALSQWENAGAAIDTAFGNAGVTTAQTLDKIDTATDQAASALDDFDNAAKKAENGVDDLGDTIDRTRRETEDYDEQNRETTDGLRDLEELLVAAGIVRGLEEIGRALVSTVEDAIEFESAITGVYKTVDGTPEQLAAISDGVKDLSLVIPSTTTEIAAVAEAAGQLGIATENIMGFTEVMINLGESTNLTSDEAASSLAKFANITKMNAAEYENLGSTIVALGNNFATTEADIVAMATRMASAGSLAGLTEAEILALAASVSSVGIEADAGGSSMSTLMSKITLAVETGNESLEQYASVANMTAEEFQRAWGESAVDALYAFIAGLNDTERNGASATAILDEMGITEIRLSNAVKALSANHEGLRDAVDLASGAWDENNALATEAEKRYATLESKLAMTENASKNLSTAIGEVFTPTVSAGSDVLYDLLNGLTGFVKENPAVVKGLAALTVGLGTFVAGITAYVAITKVATIATTALKATFASHPLMLFVTAVTSVVVALGTLAVTLNDTEDEMESLTATSRKQAKELEALEAEYDRVCDAYGENSYEAWVLKQEVDEATASFEANRQTADELQAELDGVTNSLIEAREAYEEATTEIENEYESSISLIAKLEELSSSSEKAATNQALIIPIVDELNSRYEDLDLTFDKLTGKFNLTAAEIREIAKAEAELKQAGIDYDRYVEAIGGESSSKTKLDKAKAELELREKELEAATLAYNDAVELYQYSDPLTQAFMLWEPGDALTEAEDAYETAKANVGELQTEYDDLINTIQTFEKAYGYTGDTVEDTTDGMITYKDAVSNALSSVQEEVNELCATYDEAYAAARDSIDGQIGLFDKMVVEAELSVEEMQGAWESQIQYLITYKENLEKAMEYGLDKDLISQLSDGSEESMANLDTIIGKVEELGGTTEEAKKFVDGFNAKFQEVETAKDQFAGTVADMETDFTEKMLEMEKQLDKSIDNMNMEDDAAKAAKDTMSAYVQEIIAGGNSAVTAAENAAAKVAAALNGEKAGTAKTGRGGGLSSGRGLAGISVALDAYASGTEYAAPGVAVVGEDGPELIQFGGGERVYPADETSRILANAPENFGNTGGKSDSKTIHIDINGSGAIAVDGSMDEETVVGILYNHIKPVLTSIVKQEIFEEGDLAYDY